MMTEAQQPLKPTRWLMQQANHQRSWFLTAVFVGVLQTLVTILQLGFIAHIIYSAFILKMPLVALTREFACLLAAVVVRAAMSWLKEIVGFKTGAKVRASIRAALVNHINSQGPVVPRRFTAGELSTIVVEQVEALHDYYAYYLPQMYLVIFVPILILAVVFTFNWLSALILLLCGPLIPLFMALVGMGAASANRRNFQALGRMSAHFLDVLQGLTTLKLFNRSHDQLKVIEKVSDSYRQKTMSVLRIAFMSSGVLEFFSAVSIALVAVMLGLTLLGHIPFGGYGQMTLFGALFILLLAPEFFLPLRELGAHYHARAQAVAAAEGIQRVFALSTSFQGNQSTQCDFEKKAMICFNQVSFTYGEKENDVLKNVNFTINPGEHIYIVGESGAGKTTILNLIMGFLSSTTGDVLVNGESLNATPRENLLKQISWLGQTPKLLHASLLDNLLIANPAATQSQIDEALKAANVYDFVCSLPNGLRTMVGEQGAGISGGQAQRIALARAFLKDTPLLLLDEPTANLDVQSEAQVLVGLNQLTKNKTVITLTHRLNQLPADARVLVLKDGEIAEQGLCADLLSTDTHLSQLAELERDGVLL